MFWQSHWKQVNHIMLTPFAKKWTFIPFYKILYNECIYIYKCLFEIKRLKALINIKKINEMMNEDE